jgi:hypothetical protein
MLLGDWFLTFQWPICLYLEPVKQSFILDYMTLENEDTSGTTYIIHCHILEESNLDQDIIPARNMEQKQKGIFPLPTWNITDKIRMW